MEERKYCEGFENIHFTVSFLTAWIGLIILSDKSVFIHVWPES